MHKLSTFLYPINAAVIYFFSVYTFRLLILWQALQDGRVVVGKVKVEKMKRYRCERHQMEVVTRV